MSEDRARESWGRPSQRTTAVSGVDAVIAPANPNRRALIISAAAAGSALKIALNRPAVTPAFLFLSGSGPPLLLTERDFGRLVQAEFHATCVGPDNVTVWELEG